MQIIGIDIGSSSVKVSVLNGDTGKLVASAFAPDTEMKIKASKSGWAEQDPECWYQNLKIALQECLQSDSVSRNEIKAIGISYQMHGLVAVDKAMKPVRPSIIWCDSRAVEIGDLAYKGLGKDYCQSNLLNSPGNFTASKLAWLKVNEPGNYEKIFKIMLPGDYIAMKLTGEIRTTVSGLSEGIFWDFKKGALSQKVLDYYGFDRTVIPDVVSTFSDQGHLSRKAAVDLGLNSGIPVTYRAGDQPNNAMSLNVLEPGEIAATAGTSGVLYGITDKIVTDSQSRVNIFAHVNHNSERNRLGVLACINGTGIMNAWVRRLGHNSISYNEMNTLAGSVNPGSDGLTVFPFGNGAERVLGNRDIGASIRNLNLNIHGNNHICRAVQESIAYSFRYGFDIMEDIGMTISVIRAGSANMFLSPLFRQLIADLTGATIYLYNTDGSLGAARGAGVGCGFFSNLEEAFSDIEVVNITGPDSVGSTTYSNLYSAWVEKLKIELQNK